MRADQSTPGGPASRGPQLAKQGRVTLSTYLCRVPTVMNTEQGRTTEGVPRRVWGQRVLAWVLGVAFSFPFGAHAGSLELAQTAFAQGRFIDAARIAEDLGTPDGLMLAARSLQIHGHFIAEAEEADPYLRQAIDIAAEAVRLEPENAETHVHLAAAIGRHAEAIGSFEASNREYGERIREAAREALALDPELAEAHLTMGRWHAGVIDALGSFLAGMLYDADEDEALEHLERALELKPDSKTILLESGTGMLILDDGDSRALDLLMKGIGMDSRDAAEDLLHAEVIERLEALGLSPDPHATNP